MFGPSTGDCRGKQGVPWQAALESKDCEQFVQHVVEFARSELGLTFEEILGKTQEQSLIHLASKEGAVNSLNYLFNIKEVLVQQSTQWKCREVKPFHYAVTNGIKMTKFMFEKDQTVISYSCQGFIYLLNAVEGGYYKRNRYLMEIPSVIQFILDKINNLLKCKCGTTPTQRTFKALTNFVLETLTREMKANLENNVSRPSNKLWKCALEIMQCLRNEQMYILQETFHAWCELFDSTIKTVTTKCCSFSIGSYINIVKILFSIIICMGCSRNYRNKMNNFCYSSIVKLLKMSGSSSDKLDGCRALHLSQYFIFECLMNGVSLELQESIVKVDIHFNISQLFINLSTNQKEQRRYIDMVSRVCETYKRKETRSQESIEKVLEMRSNPSSLKRLCILTILDNCGLNILSNLKSLPLLPCLATVEYFAS